MKNLMLFLFVVTGLLLASCKDSIKFEEIPIPTSPEVKIKDVLALSPQAQKVFISGITDKNEIISLFKQKFSKIIEEKITFKTDAEIKQIAVLKDFLDSETVNQISTHEREFDNFIAKWYLDTSNQFKWNNNIYKFLLYSLETDLEKYLAQQSVSSLANVAAGFDCECYTGGQGIVIKDCAGPEAKCKSKNSCANNQTGCGSFWLRPCDGACEIERTNPPNPPQ